MRSKTFDRYASLVFMAIGLLFIEESRKISHSAYGSNVGSDIFPFGLGVILVLISARLLYETFRYPGGRTEKQALDYKRFLVLLSATVLYALLLERLGYVISTFLFLLAGFQTLERKKPLQSVLVAALFAGIVYFVYVDVLDGTLPGLPVWFE